MGENAPNEANFDETMSIVEARDSIEVTANPGALSGLDKGVAQPGLLANSEYIRKWAVPIIQPPRVSPMLVSPRRRFGPVQLCALPLKTRRCGRSSSTARIHSS
jgi:hypothetical protein